MGWVKLDDGFFRHPKALAAGADGRFLAIAAICWAGHYMTDGYVPSYALPALAFDAGLSIDDAQAAADRLVEVRLWVRQPDGWAINGWSDWQSPRDERERKAQLSRDRQRRYRERRAKRGTTDGVTRESRVTEAFVTRPESEAEAEADNSTSRTHSQSVVVQGGVGDDDDGRVTTICDEIGERRHTRAVAAGTVTRNPARHLATCRANARAEYAATVARLLGEGADPKTVVEQLDPTPTINGSRAAAARARTNGATTP